MGVTVTEFDAALDASEGVLRELGATLDRPVRDDFLERALVALGKRARSHFVGFIHLVWTDAATAGFALLRPATEVNLIARFLLAKPDVHPDLWEAEAEAELLKWVRKIEGDAELAALMNWPTTSDAWKRQLELTIAQARVKGLRARVKGVSRDKRGRVMPTMADVARVHGDLSTRHAYAAAYRPLSTQVHPSARGFMHGEFRDAGEGLITLEELTDAENRIRAHRTLNATIYASTLTVLSEPLRLDVLDVAARTRDLLVTLSVAGNADQQAGS